MSAPKQGERAAPHGWLVLDKPPGMGSTAAVSMVKRVLREGGYPRVKVGHGGTLDPLAEGVLPIALGEATKLAGRMLDATKQYRFTLQLGEETDTLDCEGEVIETSDHFPAAGEIEPVLARFRGPIDQAPPAYSAIRIDGQRAHARARAGERLEMALRKVTVHRLECLGLARGKDDEVRAIELAAHVSKGTYIRSLARDIARALDSCGHVTFLRRTRAGPFGEEQAISLDKWARIGKGASIADLILPLEAGLDDIPALYLDPEGAQAVRQGRILSGMPQDDGLYLARRGKTPLALVRLEAGTLRVVRGFNLPDVAE